MKTLIKNATLVSEGRTWQGALLIDGGHIEALLAPAEADALEAQAHRVVDAEGCYLLPGVIDTHVHFREPGLTHKADIATESRAAAAGGVTSVMDMPNVVPQTTDLDTLEARFLLGAEHCRVNYSYYFGVTNSNADLLPRLDTRRVCGVKLFMGSSTGNMLVDRREALRRVFAESPLPIVAHCEDSARISEQTVHFKALYGDDPAVEFHPQIRDAEACYRSSALAVELAEEAGARLHIAHVTTARELELFSPSPLCGTDGTVTKRITAEVCVPHLLYSDADYARLGTRIKCNPAVKTATDRDALRRALTDGRLDTLGTDHAPHLLSEKLGGALKAVSGMPMVQFSLPAMLGLVDEGVLPIERLVELMCHAPARLFGIEGRGFLRPGYQADLVLVRPACPHTVQTADVLSKCGWSPLEGEVLSWRVEQTYCNGHLVYDHGRIDDDYRGEALTFGR